MQRYRELLGELGQVRSFDYPYMRDGARRAPDKLELLVSAHRIEVEAERIANPAQKLVLAGKSMGGRVGCHVGQNGRLRDEVLLRLKTPVLFVQGTRDTLCALPELERVRKQMTAPSELLVVAGGDHSLEVTKTALKAGATSQAEVELGIRAGIARFCASL